MKATRVLLRWYKSFNINYRREGPARITEQDTPWNRLQVSDKLGHYYPFIEIPLEGDITTVVGGNESGKSHLLSAVAKVLTGRGVDGRPFRQTDLCRYATVPEHLDSNSRWPQLGLRFESTDEAGEDLAVALRKANITDVGRPRSIVVIIGDPDASVGANIFVESGPSPRKIKPDELEELRTALPRVEFIDARAALPDNLMFSELATAFGADDVGPNLRYAQAAAQKSASFLQRLSLEPAA